MSYKELFKLETNPFRTTPSLDPQEIVWAGFSNLREQIKERIKYSMKIPNSSLILNWGDYGSGKTHSALYFSSSKILNKLADQENKPSSYPLYLLLPKGRNISFDFFTSIIDRLNLRELREEFEDDLSEINRLIEANSPNEQINKVVFQLFKDEIDVRDLKQYLYGTLSPSDLKNNLSQYGLYRFLDKDEDYVNFISLFFLCLTFEQKHYSSVILWIDEFEDIASLSSSGINNVNDFIRELFNKTPNYLLLFLNFTLAPVDGFQDISKHLSPALVDRIKTRIEYKYPSLDELKRYVLELLNNENFRTEEVEDEYYPFTEDSIELIQEILGTDSLRAYNEAFSVLLDFADLKNIKEIDKEFVNEHKTEFAGTWE